MSEHNAEDKPAPVKRPPPPLPKERPASRFVFATTSNIESKNEPNKVIELIFFCFI